MTIYLVSDGEYSDYTVLGLYSTKEKAEEARALYAANYIEEFELDYLPPHPPGELLWRVYMLDNGDVTDVNQGSPSEKFVPFESNRFFLTSDYPKTVGRMLALWARDKEHAIKIASEKRREMLVSGEWYSND
jgi:hypothetical protein